MVVDPVDVMVFVDDVRLLPSASPEERFRFSYLAKVRRTSSGEAEGRPDEQTTRATPLSTFRWLYESVPSMRGWEAWIRTTIFRCA